MMTSRKTWSWRARLLVLLLLFAVAPMLGISLWSLGTLEKTYEINVQESLAAIARARVEGIGQLIESRRRDVELIATQILPHLIALKEADARVRAALDTPPVLLAPEPLPELEDAQRHQRLAPERVKDDVDAGVPAAATGEQDTGHDGATAIAPAAAPPVHSPAHLEDTPATRAQAEARADLYQVLRLILWDQAVFEELMVIGGDGVVIVSTFAGHEGKSAKELEYFASGLKAAYLQPAFLSPITGNLTMVLAAPIRGAAPEKHGVLAARLNLERFFRMINDLTGLGRTGEIVVGKQVGDVVEIVAPTRHAGRDALGMQVAMGAAHSRGLQEAARGLEGASTTDRDSRGKPVIAAWLPVPSLGWGLVVKIDHDEATEPVHAVQNQTWLMALILLMVAAVSALVVSRELVRPLRELKDATDRISRGDLDVQLEIRSNDEIGELADSFERMVAAIKFFREHARPVEDDAEEDAGGAPTEPQ